MPRSGPTSSDRSDPFTEMLVRLAGDRRALSRFLGPPAPGPLVGARPGLSDPHDGGRTVWELTFASGARVFYKPRDGSVEAAFGRLAGWCARRGARPRLRVPRLLVRPGYAWVEPIESRALAGTGERRRYHQRAGALLALLDLLEARDVHRENLIAAGPDPVPIDLEMLLQPRRHPGPEPNDADESALSVLRTGLLPYAKRIPGGAIVERSGLGTRAPGADVERGFRSMYRFLAAHRRELGRRDGPLAALLRCRVRVAIRDSATYAWLLREPRRSRRALLPAERTALARGDLPWFHVRPNATDLESGPTVVARGWFAAPAAVRLRARLAAMSPADLAERIAIIRATLWFGSLWRSLPRSGGRDGAEPGRSRRRGRS